IKLYLHMAQFLFNYTITASIAAKVNDNSSGFSVFMEMTPIQSEINKIYQDEYLHCALDHDKTRSTTTSFKKLFGCNECKEYYTDNNIIHNYLASTSEELQ
ncbi:4179_t:CDS:2, partial [Racocetra persica]